MKITLYWRIPSKKNSKQIVRWRIISSKADLQWEKEQINNLIDIWQEIHIKPPFKIICDFYMPDRRLSDLSNKFESIADMLVKYWLFEDDNYTILQNIELNHKWYDKKEPRCEIEILESSN